MDRKLATVNHPLADLAMEISDEFQKDGMFGSNPLFQGQHADASWCSDLGSWIMPNDSDGCPHIADASPISWEVFNNAWERSQNVTKEASRDHVPSHTLEPPPFATVNPQQLTVCRPLPIAQPKQHSAQASHNMNGLIPQPIKAIIPPQASSKASPGIKPAVAPACKLKGPQQAVRKAVGPRNGPVPATTNVPQKNMMPAVIPSWQNGFAARGQAPGLGRMGRGQAAGTVAAPGNPHPCHRIGVNKPHKSGGSTGASISAQVVAKHVLPTGGEPNSQRPPQPIGPKSASKPGDHAGGFVPAVWSARNEIRRLREILERHQIPY